MTAALTDLEQACNDLAAWLPRVAALTAETDTVPVLARGKPCSTTPGNTVNSNALFDALEGIRRLREDMLSEVTGRYIRDPLPHAQTGRILESIPKLAAAVSDETRQEVTWQLARYTTVFLRLAPIDLEQPPKTYPCPRCNRKLLVCRENSDQVGCYGCYQKATIIFGYVSGELMLTWADGWMP